MQKDPLYKQQAENFSQLKKDLHISQRDLKEITGVTEATVSAWCKGRKQIRRAYAEMIVEKYPEYTVQFLRGETPFMNVAQQTRQTIIDGITDGTRLRASVMTLADLSGFNIDVASFERTGDDVIDTVHEYTSGCDIIRGNRLLHLDMDEMDAFENYVCDFVELTLDRLMRAKGIDRKEN